MAGTVKKLEFAEGANVTEPTDLTLTTSTSELSTYASDMEYVTEQGAATEGSVYINSTLNRLRYYTGGSFNSARPDAATLPLEDPGVGTNTVTLSAPNALASSYTLTMPADGGTSGYAVVTDGSGNLSYASVASNPMTTQGDVIYGGTSGVPTRLAKGTSGQFLKIGASVPSWAGITGTDVTPNFGSQNISTTGTLGLSSSTVINSAVKTAETVSHFAYGTWTPFSDFSGGNGTRSDSNANGWWIRVGNVVTVGWTVDVTKGTASGNLFIGGLPFNSLNSGGLSQSTFTVGLCTNITIGNTQQLAYALTPNNSNIAVALINSGGAIGSVTAALMSTVCAVYGSGSYRIA